MTLTNKIREKIETRMITKMELSERLGISRVTLDTRLEKSNWKKGEIALLKQIA